jgi:hypothetical protein
MNQRVEKQHELDVILAFGADGRSVAPTHKAASTFHSKLQETAQRLDVDVDVFSLMGVYVLGQKVFDFVEELPESSDVEISMSARLQKNLAMTNWDVAFYSGPWWHLAYPNDFEKLKSKLDDLELPALTSI